MYWTQRRYRAFHSGQYVVLKLLVGRIAGAVWYLQVQIVHPSFRIKTETKIKSEEVSSQAE